MIDPTYRCSIAKLPTGEWELLMWGRRDFRRDEAALIGDYPTWGEALAEANATLRFAYEVTHWY